MLVYYTIYSMYYNFVVATDAERLEPHPVRPTSESCDDS